MSQWSSHELGDSETEGEDMIERLYFLCAVYEEVERKVKECAELEHELQRLDLHLCRTAEYIEELDKGIKLLEDISAEAADAHPSQ